MHHRFITGLDGREYWIDIDEEGETITIGKDHEELGCIHLTYDPEHLHRHEFDSVNAYYITSLELDRCKRRGLGEAALRFHKLRFETPLLAAYPGGPKMSDGSHLIDDGPGFIQRMRQKGIVCGRAE